MHKEAMAAQASSKNQLGTTEEILGAQSALMDAMGNTNRFSAETAMNISNLSTAFGIAVGDAAQVQAQFENMGESSKDAFQTAALTANLADAAGVAPGKVMKDIAQNGKKAAKYFGGATKALAKAAVEAARLGLSLSDMVAISDSLLDIESSVTAEFEASVMLGKTINMDKARSLALDGKAGEAMKETLKQVGTLAELTAMGPLQRKAAAKAAGLEVGALMEAAQHQEHLNNMSAEQKKRYDEASEALKGATLTPEDIVAQQEAALAAKEMSAQFSKIKNILMKSLMPVVKIITGIFTDVLSPVLDVIGAAFKTMMFVLSPVLLVIKGIAKIISTIAPALKVIAGLFGVIYGIKALIWAGDKISMGIQATKAAFATKEATQATLLNVARKMGLITSIQENNATMARGIAQRGIVQGKGRESALQKSTLGFQLKASYIAAKDWTVATGRAIAEQAKNTAMALGNALGLTGQGIAVSTGVTEKAGLLTRIASNVQRAAAWAWEGAINIVTGQGWLIEQGKAAVKAISAMWTQLSIGFETTLAAVQSKGLMKTIGQAAMTVYKSAASIPYVGWILGAVAAAAVVGLGMSFMNDGVVSGKTGGGGYGSRVLFGPEGSISFNNDDDIVAGTNLFGNDVISRANDAVFAPKGAIKMNDGAIGGGMGDMPDPPESKIVDLGSDAIKKMAIAVGLGTFAGGMLLKAIPQMTFEINPFTFSPLGGLLGMIGGGLAAGAVGASMAGGGEETAPEATLDTIAEKLDLLITAAGGTPDAKGGAKEPVQIVIGNKVIEEIGSQMNINQSYTIAHGSGGEEG